jgi:hypothetical protein
MEMAAFFEGIKVDGLPLLPFCNTLSIELQPGASAVGSGAEV